MVSLAALASEAYEATDVEWGANAPSWLAARQAVLEQLRALFPCLATATPTHWTRLEQPAAIPAAPLPSLQRDVWEELNRVAFWMAAYHRDDTVRPSVGAGVVLQGLLRRRPSAKDPLKTIHECFQSSGWLSGP